MATPSESLPPSVLRPKDINPMVPSAASVHLRHSYINPRRATVGERLNRAESTQPKEPLTPSAQSVYMRTGSDTQLLKNMRENSAARSSIASDDLPLSSISEGQYSSRASVASAVSDDFYWPNDVIFEVLNCAVGVEYL